MTKSSETRQQRQAREKTERQPIPVARIFGKQSPFSATWDGRRLPEDRP